MLGIKYLFDADDESCEMSSVYEYQENGEKREIFYGAYAEAKELFDRLVERNITEMDAAAANGGVITPIERLASVEEIEVPEEPEFGVGATTRDFFGTGA